jgi:predicted dehydrogenase
MSHSLEKLADNSKQKTIRNVEELYNTPKVGVVLIASNHAFHASQALLALQANKHVFVEKPIALTTQDTDRIIAADKAAGGGKTMIGYMRRYAAAFVDAVKEVGTSDRCATPASGTSSGPTPASWASRARFPGLLPATGARTQRRCATRRPGT